MPSKRIEIIRTYEDPGRKRGEYRVLVDRLWPRGLTKEEVDFDEWTKQLAPSGELRKWYGHEVERFREFSRRYRHELKDETEFDEVKRLRGLARSHSLVLLTATRDVEHSGAEVLRRVLLAAKR